MMCHRCEYRAQFKEKGNAPRYECGSDSSVFCCYMYRPVQPIVLQRAKGDPRPLTPALLSCRQEYKKIAECELKCAKTKVNRRIAHIFYWEPK